MILATGFGFADTEVKQPAATASDCFCRQGMAMTCVKADRPKVDLALSWQICAIQPPGCCITEQMTHVSSTALDLVSFLSTSTSGM